MRALASLAIVATSLSFVNFSDACVGMRDFAFGRQFPARPPTEDEIVAELPFTSTEQALVIWDEEKKTEHLVMELRFDTKDTSFGLLVPVPSTPTIEKVAQTPFNSLRDIYTFTPQGLGTIGIGLFGGGGLGMGQGRGTGALDVAPPPPAVEVLDEHPVGSFTAFTLAIHDARELAAWLTEHQLIAPKAVDTWAERYARMDFTLIALKYTQGADAGKGMTSETIRISFATPLPFFPYSEPVTSKLSKRLLAGWTIASAAMRPIARNEMTFAQPWKSGERYTASHDELALILKDLSSVIPNGDKLVVQTYRDWKTTRQGFGDVVLVPEKQIALDDNAKNERKRFLGLLDPDLVPPPKPAPVPVTSASIAPSTSASAAATPPPEKSGCNASGASGSPLLLLLAMIAMRRSRIALVALVACSKTEQKPVEVEAATFASAPIVSASVAPPAPSSTLAPEVEQQKRSAALAILSGDAPDGGFFVSAGTAPIPPPPPPTVSAPTIVFGDFNVTGALDKDIAKTVVRRNLGRYRMCYQRALQANPTIDGKGMLSVLVGADGTVSSASFNFSSSNEVQNCIGQMTRSINFPTASGTTTIVVPLTLKHPN